MSQQKRKQIEEPFGWMKTIGIMRKTRHRGRALVEWLFVLTATAHNLIRIPKILAAPCQYLDLISNCRQGKASGFRQASIRFVTYAAPGKPIWKRQNLRSAMTIRC